MVLANPAAEYVRVARDIPPAETAKPRAILNEA
jgi:hypothetical protein